MILELVPLFPDSFTLQYFSQEEMLAIAAVVHSKYTQNFAIERSFGGKMKRNNSNNKIPKGNREKYKRN